MIAVESLQKHYPIRRRGVFRRRSTGAVRAVDDVSFTVASGETLGLVGESGCGKTTTARAMLHLIEPSAGRVLLEGEDVLAVFRRGERREELRLRRRMQYVFQDPYLSLNPRWTVAETILEPLRVHAHVPRAQWEERLAHLLDLVGLEAAHAARYPHECSGGQRQRVGIARALAVEPGFLICDEPVSSLDVSVRAQILNLLVELQERLGLTYLYISHDLASVRFIAGRVAVMYLGRIVETANVETLFAHPRHHYTAALLAAIPVPDPDTRIVRAVVAGELPSAMNIPPGCRFHPRCPAALPSCREIDPPLELAADGHLVACHNPR